jgi:hypothetical protein
LSLIEAKNEKLREIYGKYSSGLTVQSSSTSMLKAIYVQNMKLLMEVQLIVDSFYLLLTLCFFYGYLSAL